MFGSKIYTTMDLTNNKGLDVSPNPREHNTFKTKIILLRLTRLFRSILIQHQTYKISEIKGIIES